MADIRTMIQAKMRLSNYPQNAATMFLTMTATVLQP